MTDYHSFLLKVSGANFKSTLLGLVKHTSYKNNLKVISFRLFKSKWCQFTTQIYLVRFSETSLVWNNFKVILFRLFTNSRPFVMCLLIANYLSCLLKISGANLPLKSTLLGLVKHISCEIILTLFFSDLFPC